MSIINKKPFINIVLERLSDENKATLKTLINGGGDPLVKKSLVPLTPNVLTASDKGVKRVQLELPGVVAQKLYEGFLIYTDYTEGDQTKTQCVLISYTSDKNQRLSLIDMNLVGGIWYYHITGCNLTILELRSELYDEADINVAVDSALSNTSENPVQNKVITAALNGTLKVVDVTNSTTIVDAANLGKPYIMHNTSNNKYFLARVTISGMSAIYFEFEDLLGQNRFVGEVNDGTLTIGSIQDTSSAYYKPYALENDLAPGYDSTHTYNTGDLVSYNGGLYVCNTDNTTGDWASAKWDATTISASLGNSSSTTFVDWS